MNQCELNVAGIYHVSVLSLYVYLDMMLYGYV